MLGNAVVGSSETSCKTAGGGVIIGCAVAGAGPVFAWAFVKKIEFAGKWTFGGGFKTAV